MSKYLLGIDNGSTVSKVALFATSGEEIATAARKVNLIELKPGWRENIGNGRGGREGFSGWGRLEAGAVRCSLFLMVEKGCGGKRN